MIFELKKSDFYKCKDIVYEQGHLEVKAVIEGNNPGRIFVDDPISPNSGLLWLGNNDGFFFIGKEENKSFNNELNDFITRFIVPEAKKQNLKWFEVVGNHPNWDKTIVKIFKHRNLGSWNQKVYVLEKEQYNYSNEPRIDKEYHIFKIDRILYENKDNSIENIDFIHSKILEYWPTPESFFNQGIGYCMVCNNKVVSVCFSGFVYKNVHCVDIETLKDHRGKKLAQKMAHSFVKECFKNGMVPYWDCMEGNKPSVSVAEKIGFTNVFNYVGYEFSLED